MHIINKSTESCRKPFCKKCDQIILSIIFFLLLVQCCNAATLHGSVYDIELNEIEDAVIEIDTEPAQRILAKEGTYSFELNPGNYTLSATHHDGLNDFQVSEKISVKNDGDYIFDIFLFPELPADDADMFSEDDLDIADELISDRPVISAFWLFIVLISIIFLLVAVYLLFGRYRRRESGKEILDAEKLRVMAEKNLREAESKQHKPAGTIQKLNRKSEQKDRRFDLLDEQLLDVVEVITKEDGRISQKELRRKIPLSEAKISLMITELEDKGILKKVKKGRGNILILQK